MAGALFVSSSGTVQLERFMTWAFAEAVMIVSKKIKIFSTFSRSIWLQRIQYRAKLVNNRYLKNSK